MDNQALTQLQQRLDALVQRVPDENIEFWFARDLLEPLGYARIRSRGDTALFGGKSTQAMKDRYGIVKSRPLADFLPTLTIAAKNLATEMTNHNVQQADLQSETAISKEHVQNNLSVRGMLDQRGIKPEELPVEEDIRKLEQRVKTEEKQIAKQAPKLPADDASTDA
ncbi:MULTISPECIES: hypothetical protein [Pseudomonadaceae]|uniref:hypothetical protein n=1 Tax=Pseudomonadaceae TaxID=135621 RepID=UPI0019099D3E|nr:MULTISPECIES: hypothetical protein [Pseudomonadaceae]MBK3848604.1 hypothetical protein [Stutzerimonas xanthomarina]